VPERNRIVLAHQWLVRAVAADYLGRGMDRDDLVSEGQLGLLRAAELFDPDFGVPFTVYATPRVRLAITRALAERGPAVRVPIAARNLVASYRRSEPGASEPIADDRDQEPSMQRFLSACPGRHRPSRFRAALRATRLRGVRWSENGCERSGSTAEGYRAGQHAFARVDDRDWVERALARLGARDADVLRARFGLDGPERPLREVGRRVGVSPERARQLVERAIQRIRGWSAAQEHERQHHSNEAPELSAKSNIHRPESRAANTRR
jgi:RNA polymerase primary sigma factor